MEKKNVLKGVECVDNSGHQSAKSKSVKTRNRKRRYKVMSEEKQKLNVKKTVTKYPISANEASSNWKTLCSEIDELKLQSRRKKPKKQSQKPSVQKETIWFDVNDPMALEEVEPKSKPVPSDEHLVKEKSFSGLTKTVAMDCEMVGVGVDGDRSIVARVSLVNHFGHCIYDKYVKPTEKVTNFRTNVSGIRPSDLRDAEEFKVVQKAVYDIIKNRILVGHAVNYDLKVLFLDHPKKDIRDTSKFFRHVSGGRTPSLRRLAEQLLGVSIQSGEHSSVEDARVAMRLYTMHRKAWEQQAKSKLKLKKSKIKSRLNK